MASRSTSATGGSIGCLRRRVDALARSCPTTAGDGGARTARGGGSTAPSQSSRNRAGVLADPSLFEETVPSTWKSAENGFYVGIDSTAKPERCSGQDPKPEQRSDYGGNGILERAKLVMEVNSVQTTH